MTQGKVAELDSRRPHVNAPMRCTECGHEFRSIHLASLKVQWWECPKCHEMAAQEVK